LIDTTLVGSRWKHVHTGDANICGEVVLCMADPAEYEPRVVAEIGVKVPA
jgi:hypothetical protein